MAAGESVGAKGRDAHWGVEGDVVPVAETGTYERIGGPGEMVGEANQAGARLASACDGVGVAVRTFERWMLNGEAQAHAPPGYGSP